MSSTTHSTRRFALHYVEMVAVMFAGMFALAMPVDALINAVGGNSSKLSPAMSVFVMALDMTLPMIAWMRYRGHSWRPNLEMAGSMMGPAFAAMVLIWMDVASRMGAMMLEHGGMLACMLAVMLYRREEYSCSHRRALATV